MENIKGILNSGVVEGELSDVESDGSGELESGEEVSESSDEEPPPPPPPPPPKRPIIRSNKKHNNIIRRIPHRDFLKQKRKSEALKAFHKFSKKMKLDTGLSIKTIAGGDIVELDELLSDSDESITKEESESSDGLSESEFTVDLEAALEPEGENESFIDPETGAITVPGQKPAPVVVNNTEPSAGEESIDSAVTSDNKTLTISDIIEEGSEFDLDKNVDIEEILGANQFTIEKKKSFEEGGSSEPQETEEMKESTKRTSGEIKSEHSETNEIKSEGSSETASSAPATSEATKAEDEKNKNAINLRRNIREVMDEKNLDASTLTAQRQESERLARVQEQQRIIREVRRQIALGRQQGASLLKGTNLKNLNLPGTVLMKVPSGTEAKKIGTKPGQVDVLKIQLTKGNLTPSVSIAPVGAKPDIKIVKDQDKKEVVEIVDSSSSSSSSESPSSDSDDCIMLSDSEVPPSPEADEDPNNCGLHVNDTYNVPDEQGRVQINIGHPENEEDIFLAPQIARIIKPHQIGGVRFLFDNIIESVERFSTSTGFGCILAHSMGLGKTLQIVCFTDIFLRHTKSKTVLCIMPINTLQNWVAEFNMWLPTDPSTSPLSAQGEVRPRNFPIFVLNDNHKTLEARAKVIKEWSTQGGVLMIGYELYRLLSLKKNKKPRLRKKKNDPPESEKTAHTKVTTDSKNSDDKDKEKDESKDSSDTADGTKKSVVNGGTEGEETKDGEKAKTDEKDEAKSDKPEKEEELDEEAKLLNEIFNALVKPGPDLVICDEGHRIKNSHSNISYALKQMRTKRRVVLTGYPLQNNLLEYWCMVDFVRPNYLGTKTEFSNMFERPIQNGQCIDSTPQDIRLMRYRAHVLHSLLLGFVQRRSHAVLQSTLPQKEEYVLLIKMTDLQRKLYDTFMNEVVRKKTVPNPLKAFAVCCKIWNHPDVLYYFLKQRSEMAAIIDYDLDIEDANPGVTAAALAAARRAVGNNPIIRKPGRGRGAPRKTDKIPLPNKPGNNGKPAASIPPNSSGSTDYNAYDPNKAGQTNRPNQYNFGGDVNQAHPYPYNYQQYPSQPNYSYNPQNNSYNPQYNNEYYSQQQPYNNYNQQYPPNATQPPPPQHYPQNSQYSQQGYWGPDNNYYHHNNYYPNSQPPYQPTPDAYGNVYDPYAQQSYQGYPNPARPYDANAPPPSGTYNQNIPPQHRPYDAGVPNQNGSYNSNVPPQPRPYDPNIPNPSVPYDANVPPRPYDSNIPNPSQAYDANSSNVNSSYGTNPPAASHPFEPNPQNPSRSYDPNVPNSNAPYDANLINTNRTFEPSLSNSQPFDSNVPNVNNGPYDPNLSTSNRPYDPSITNANQPYDPNLPNQNRPYDSNGNPPQQYNPNIPNANRPFNSNIPNQNQPYNSNVVNTNQPYNSNAPNMPPYNPKGDAPNTQYDPNLSNSSSSYESNTSHPNQPYDPNLPSPNKNFNEPSTTNPLTPYDKNIPARPCDAPNNTANGVLPCGGYPGGIQAQAPSIPPGPYGTNNYNQPYPGYPATNTDVPPIINDVKPPIPMDSTPSWPIPSSNENSAKPTDLIDNIKTEIKEEPDGDIKIADLDTKNVFNDVKSEIKTEIKSEVKGEPENVKVEKSKKENTESPKNNLENDGKKTEQAKNTPEKPESVKTDEKTLSKKNKKPKEKIKDKKHGKKSKEKSKSKEDEESGKESEEEKKEEEKPEIKEEVPYEWANDLLKNFVPGIIENSAKMELLFCILEESVKIGDRILLFSQSLFTLNLIEDYLQKNFIYGTEVYWCRNRSYYRLDGSTTALEREKLINEFNSNPNVHLFLVSTRAGSLGINLVGANRVVVFDASWNPCHDTQAVCRVYRYGQQKPCFVYRFVMDNCLEKKIYDRQINKQGMSDRVVDECNPDAVLSMKEVTNLCWDEEKDPDSKEVDPACVDKYRDNVIKIIISEHIKTLSKEPFQHESLLVDRKEKKLSSAEKRLAQRGYELEKKAAANPKPTMMYRTIRTADGTIIQRPVASVRPMQHGGSGARWIPAEVWQRQGMTAQEMTLPLDVVIPTNSAEKTNIVLKAGQRVMVLKSPKGIYMQLESGKIIAIKTSFKVGQKPGENTNKDASAIKKGLPVRPSNVNLPGSLKNNSAITVMKSGRGGGMQKVITRPNLPNKPSIRPILPMTRIQDMKVRPMNPTMSVRGRPPLTRPTRPIPIQNSLNIKVQGNQSLLNVDKEKVAVEKDKSIVEKEKPKEDVVQNSTESPLPSTITAPIESKEIKLPKDCTVKIAPKKIECDDVFEESTSQSKILEPSTLPEDVISEDSSQEKTYVDLSDKTESKITTKPSSKKVATPIKQTPAVMKDCKIPIKNSFLPNETVPLTFLNQVTIKRTTVTPQQAPTTSAVPLPAATSTPVNTFKAGPVNLAADEILPSEATLTEHKLPTINSQPPQSVLADDNSMEEEEMKEKKIYKPNLVDRKTKINSLKNYRHQKSLQKPIPIQSDLSVSKMSPLSSSSTPTPPPPTKTPDKFESSLSRLEKTATSITRMTKPGGMSDFQQSLNDITRTYSPESEQVYKPGPKSRKKKMQSPMEESSEAAEVTNSAAHIPVDPSVGKTPSATPGYGDAHYPQPLPGPPLEHFGYSGYPPSAGSYPPPAGTYPPAPTPYPPVPGPPYYQGYPPAPGPMPYPPYHPPQSYPPVPYPPAALPYANPNPNPNPPQW